MLRRSLASFAVLGLFATPALAADGTPSSSWTGVYLGLNGNWNFLSTDVSSAEGDLGSQSGNGIGGGLQLGFDYQMGPAVLGIQAITAITGVESDDTVNGSKLGAELTSYGSLNARLGYLLQPDLLGYAKGGMAFGSFKYSSKNAETGFSGSQDDERHQGWMLGGGVEYRFAPNWSVFAEYDYSFFGEETVKLDDKNSNWGNTARLKYDQNIGSAVLGVNYRF